jgi:3-oxoadipate enol-lactonase
MPWTDVNGVSLHYLMRGSGAAFLCLHEIGGSTASFTELADLLSPTLCVVTYDQRGAGLSEKPVGALSLDDLVADLRGLVHELGLASGGCHLLTVAAAGLQAVRLALEYPELVRSVTLCNPALGVDTARAAALEDRAALAEREGVRASADATLDRSYPTEFRHRDRYLDYRARFLASSPHGLAEGNRVLAASDLRARLGQLNVPFLVLAGDDDRVRPPTVTKELADRIPGAIFEVIRGGHLLTTTSPAAVASSVQAFLGRTMNGQGDAAYPDDTTMVHRPRP